MGVVANQPVELAGSIDVAAADKAAHFISVCDAFHLPLLFLADNPGVLAGTASERAGGASGIGSHVRRADLRHHRQDPCHAAQGPSASAAA